MLAPEEATRRLDSLKDPEWREAAARRVGKLPHRLRDMAGAFIAPDQYNPSDANARLQRRLSAARELDGLSAGDRAPRQVFGQGLLGEDPDQAGLLGPGLVRRHLGGHRRLDELPGRHPPGRQFQHQVVLPHAPASVPSHRRRHPNRDRHAVLLSRPA